MYCCNAAYWSKKEYRKSGCRVLISPRRFWTAVLYCIDKELASALHSLVTLCCRSNG
jgi:hypothetical protein